MFFWFSGVEVGTKIEQTSIGKSRPRRDVSFCDPKTPQEATKTPQDAPKTPQDAPKTRPRRPKTPPRRAQDAPRRAQYAPKTPQDGLKRRTKRPKTPQDAGKKGFQKRSEAQSPPDLDFGAFWGGFWTVFGMILEGFRVDLGGQMEQDRYTEGHSEPPRATESHRDSQRAIGKNREPQRATESHREPKKPFEKKRRFPFLIESGLCWDGFASQKSWLTGSAFPARNVVFRLAPQDNSVGRGRSGGGWCPAAPGGTAGG